MATANNVVTTSFTVSFGAGSGEGGMLKAEVDDRLDGVNKGKTSFIPGDPVGWLLFKTQNGAAAVTVDAIVTSLGTVSPGQASSKEVTETLQFANEATANLGYPITGNFKSIKWVGNSLGNLVIVNETTVKIADFKGTPLAPQVGVVEVVYDSPCQVYTLTHTPPESILNYEILVYIAGHTGA